MLERGAPRAESRSPMTRIPRLTPERDLSALSLSAAESQLLSRIDGALGEQGLARLTGLGPEEVASALVRLCELGAVELVDPPVQEVATVRAASPPPIASSSPLLAPSDAVPPWAPTDLEEDVELAPERRRQILDAFHRLDRLTYYELLGVHELSDKRQIKAAYYAVAPEFHPDKYFRKRLGSFKQRAEAIFTRLTLAHDVLTTRGRREQYDEYLDQLRRNHAAELAIDAALRDAAAVESAVLEAARGMVQAPQQAERAPQAVQPRVQAAQERREALARKLLGGRKLPPRVAPPPPSVPYTQAPVDAEAMRLRYEEALATARREQVVRFCESAMAAVERKDYAAAANAYRIASSLAPDDQELAALSAGAQQSAASALAEGFLKQAEYEARQEQWREAAMSYSKVCAGRPDDARAHERVAFCTMKSGGNARRAVEFSRKAVELSPAAAEYRITLAHAYIEAGLEKSALAELERAEELAPKDAKIKELVAQAKLLSTQKKAK